MSSVSIIVVDSSAAWLNREEIRLQKGLRKMGMAIVNLAELTTPKKEGDLRESGHIEGMGNEIKVIYGNSQVQYAKVQEETQFKHYTTPGTGPHFLRNSGNNIAKKGIKPYL